MRRAVWLALPILLGAWDPIQSKNRAVEAGNQQYAAGDFAAAERHYLEAKRKLPGEAGVHFDLGAALHRQALALPEGPERQQKLDAAEKELRLATDATDVKLRSRAHYNLGNTLVERKKVPDAIQEYRKALKLDAKNEDARHNLELALRMKPPEPPPQSSPKPQDQQKPEDKQNQQQQPQQQAGDQQQPEQKPQPQPSDEQQKEQKAAGEAGEDRKLSDDDVERKLAELEKRSKDLQVQKAAERSQERRRGKPVKDW